MRVAMANWLRVSAILAVACLVAAAAKVDEARRIGEIAITHRTVPSRVYEIEHGHGVQHEDGNPKLQWKFNALNPFQTFVVSKEGHGHKKCGMAAKFGSWFSNVFGHGYHRDSDEHRREGLTGRPFLRFGHHHGWLPWRRHFHQHEQHHDNHEHHRERPRFGYGEGVFAKIGGFFSGIQDQIKSWSMPAGARKAPTLQSASEPLEMHALHRLASPMISCNLRRKLSSVVVPVVKEVARTAASTQNDDPHSDEVKINMKRLMGDSMQLGILKNVCEASSMSPCEREFCDVFLSHPQSGILMAFHILSMNPLKVAVNPEAFANGLPIVGNHHMALAMSPNGLEKLKRVREARRLAHIVIEDMERLLADNSEVIVPGFEHKLKSFYSKAFGGELNPCKACLRQEIFRMKSLAKRALTAACEQPADSSVEQSCKFVKENKFVAKTMFAYKFRIWEKAALACKSRKACDSVTAPSLDSSEHPDFEVGHENHLMNREGPNFHLAHLDVNAIRHPRVMEIFHRMDVQGAPVQPRRMNCRERAAHRAAMLRGQSLNLLTTELMKAGESFSQHGEIGPVLVVEIVRRPQFQFDSVQASPRLLHLITGSLDEALKTQQIQDADLHFKHPVFDHGPLHEDVTVKSDVPEETKIVSTPSTDNALELPSAKAADADHADM